MIDAEGAALLRRATPTGMGGTPDLFAPVCPDHDPGCPDPWQCWEDAVDTYLAKAPAPLSLRAIRDQTPFRYPVPCPGYPKCLKDVGHEHWSDEPK